ncbi:phosphatase PAP2 family protein [Segatella maculosa]|uniref:phosphatase PAP2 family protein n=1 Tax=Segatella maculosa TaxID=439703 RepID=UPI0023F54D7C|nr:phosphatase PAP2 family protein [Segatella maculosa]
MGNRRKKNATWPWQGKGWTAEHKGLLPFEWVVLGYIAFTLLIVLFTSTKLVNPEAMIWGRIRVGAMTILLWAAYRMLPCKLTIFVRVGAQMAMLAWWYPDTYEINRMFPNLDHVFATWEQQLFGFQPALEFAHTFPSPIVSELMDCGYAAYYPMIAVVLLYYFFQRYGDLQKAAFIILGSFFAYYTIYDLLPVVGPTFYYKAIGLQHVAQGIFPNVGDYFNHHQDCLPAPGYTQGFFYGLVEDAKAAGERPTAAFPSSHVGVGTICMLLAWRSGSRKLLFSLLPFYVFLCMATVYIQAHYVIDAIAGVVTGVVFYGVGSLINSSKPTPGPSRREGR